MTSKSAVIHDTAWTRNVNVKTASIINAGLTLTDSATSVKSGSSGQINTRGVSIISYMQSGLSSWQNLAQYQYFLISSSSVFTSSPTADQLTAAAHPGIGLAYANPWEVTTSYNEGVTYADALANNWLAKNSSNQTLNTYSGSAAYMTLIGDASNVNAPISAYQQKFLDNCLANAAASGCTGFFFDNCFPDYSYFLQATGGGVYAATAYPNLTAWQNALKNFIKNVAGGLRARGYYVAVNSTGVTSDPNGNNGIFWQGWYQTLISAGANAVYTEFDFVNNTDYTQVRNNGNTIYPGYWSGFVQAIISCQNAGGDMITSAPILTASSNVERYVKASFLMGWNGGLGATMLSVSATGTNSGFYTNLLDPWPTANSKGTWVDNIGTPSAAYTTLATNVFFRQFSNGWVVINTNVVGGASWTGTINGVSYTVAAADAIIHTGL